MHENWDVLGQDDGFPIGRCLSPREQRKIGDQAVATSNESIPSLHHRV